MIWPIPQYWNNESDIVIYEVSRALNPSIFLKILK